MNQLLKRQAEIGKAKMKRAKYSLRSLDEWERVALDLETATAAMVVERKALEVAIQYRESREVRGYPNFRTLSGEWPLTPNASYYKEGVPPVIENFHNKEFNLTLAWTRFELFDYGLEHIITRLEQYIRYALRHFHQKSRYDSKIYKDENITNN